LKATAKAIAKDAIGLTIESQVSNEIGLDALAHDAQGRRAPDQLPLAFCALSSTRKAREITGPR
jgi:hypothetical protein